MSSIAVHRRRSSDGDFARILETLSSCAVVTAGHIPGQSMKFLSEGIGDRVLEELANAAEARIAMAFFNPEPKTLAAIGKVKKLTLIVSEEFTINDPRKLEKLKHATLRSYLPSSEYGKLHAKVIITKRRDGSFWVLLGSANITHQGMFSNQEACLSMDTSDPADEDCAWEIREWFKSLLENADTPNLEQAKLIFDARAQFQLVRRPTTKPKGAGYWALKTTSGATGKEHWPSFQADGVIAVGWSDIPVNPAEVSDEELSEAIVATYENDDGDKATAKIRKFVDLKVGDIILVCRGYGPEQEKEVHVHGLARVDGPFFDDEDSSWDWRFKHKAVLQVIDMYFPRKTISDALGKGSLMHTIHELDKTAFDRLTAVLNQAGVQVEV